MAGRDSVGAWRIQAAYEKVGISFFAGGMPKGAGPPRNMSMGKAAAMGVLQTLLSALLAALVWQFYAYP